jgi:serine/threonine-protein kinase HipA
VKNIAFLMDRAGRWSLSPAFDVIYSWNPDGRWRTGRHQMSINGKRDGFAYEDLIELARSAQLKTRRAGELIRRVHETVAAWPDHARRAGVGEEAVERIRMAHRKGLVEDTL